MTGISGSNLSGQGIDIGGRAENKLFVGINLSSAKSAVNNVILAEGIKPESKPKKSFFISFEGGYYLSKSLGISSGLGYNIYSTEYTVSDYYAAVRSVDSDNDPYERRISGKNITEKQNISMFCIPILLNFRIPFSEKSGFNVQSGINISIPASKKFKSTGTFSYSGYYEKYKLLISDVPFENFKSNIINNTTGVLELNSIIPQFRFSGGLYFQLQKNVELSAGFFYSKILSNISAYKTSSDFVLSEAPDELNSLMNFSKKFTLQAIGFSFGFRYYIK